MSNYSQNVFFGPKDALATGLAAKKIKGTEIDAELQEISDAIATKVESGGIPSGARMIFLETSAPSGFTLLTGYDTRTIILADAPTDDDVPDTAGSWTLSGIALTGSDGSHTHTDNITATVAGAAGGAAGVAHFTLAGTSNVATMGGAVLSTGSTHTHAMTLGSSWRPLYVQAIACTKD